MKKIMIAFIFFFFSFSMAFEKVENCNIGKFWKGKKLVVKGGMCDKRCELYYESDHIKDILLKFDEKCKENSCDVSFVGNYYLSEGKKCLSFPNFIEIGIGYNKENFIPFCDFVNYEKNNQNNSGSIKFIHEGTCLYKIIKTVNIDMSKKEYKFDVMKIGKGLDGRLRIEKKDEIPYYVKRENYNGEKNEMIFHSCSQNSCRVAIEGFYDKSTKVSLIPQCDFLKYKQEYSIEDGSFGTIIAKKSGSCLVMIEMSSENRGLHVAHLFNHQEKVKLGCKMYPLCSNKSLENPNYEYEWLSIGPYEKKRKSTFMLIVPKDMRDLSSISLNWPR